MVISVPAGAYFAGVVQQVEQHLLEQHRRPDRASADRAADAPASGARPGSCRRAAARCRSTSDSSTGPVSQPQRPGFQPRHVQQVADEAIEPLGLLLDVADQVQPRRGVQRVAVRRQAGGRAEDRRQRRAQIVRDRGQQRRAQPVGLGHQPRAIHVLDQVDPLDRQRRLVGQRIEQPPLIGRQHRPRLVAVDADDADRAAAGAASAGTAASRRAACRRRARRRGCSPSTICAAARSASSSVSSGG